MASSTSQAVRRLKLLSNMSSPRYLTLTYSIKYGVELPLDVYLPSDPQNLPVLIWFHGGMPIAACQKY
jgi:acetyl esterase/lipase